METLQQSTIPMVSLHVILLVLAVAAFASPSGVVAAPCNPEAHAEMVIRYCFSGTAPSIMCCNALFGSLASGMGCICNISRTRLVVSAGLSDDDIIGWFNSCGGNGDELAGVCSGAQDPSSPPPPPAQGQPALPPPPPAQGQPTLSLPAQGQPWFSGLAKLGIIFVFILVFVFGLLAVVAWGGPAGEEAAKLLRTGRSIAKAIAKRLNIPGWLQGSSSNHRNSTTTPTASNMDVSATVPVIKFLLENQNIGDIRDIDWPRAKEMLKNFRVRAKHNNKEFTVIGLSDQPCSRQTFQMKVRSGSGESKTVDITVQDYFKKKHIELTRPWLPCLDVGNPNHPIYIPIELCQIISTQHYTKMLSSQQMRVALNAVNSNRYDDDPILSSSGFEIKKQPTCIDGRILGAPMIKVGYSNKCIPKRGRWNYNNKRLLQPATLRRWAVVSFSANCDLNWISNQLIYRGRKKGIFMKPPHTLVNEDSQSRRLSAVERVEMMFEKVKTNFAQPPEFLLCVLPERKNCDIYGPWKKKSLHEMGIATQCIAPSSKMNDQYFTNVLLKINAKLGGLNSALASEHKIFQRISKIPTLILGIYVSHGSPGQASTVAVVGSVYWPQISRYKASVRTQPSKDEISDSLFKEQNGGNDKGIISELLLDFYQTSQKRKPAQIIIFRYGVCESQFSKVMNIELKQIREACKKMGLEDLPKFTVITAQKKHHMQANLPENIPPGTVVESAIVHPTRYDFFMWAHAGSVATHYHVLLDEIGFSADEIQKFVLSMSYLNQRSTTANSIVAPIHYARLAVAQMRQIIKSGAGGACLPSSSAAYPELPQLHKRVRSSMFFC